MLDKEMKIEAPENPNYAAVVVSLKQINHLEGCDNVVGTPLLGFQAIVGKDSSQGDLGIVFPAETQLSEEFASNNNLFRHSDLNKDRGAKGYLEDNRRVKAMRFRGHRSDCLFLSLESLKYTGIFWGDLEEGDTFDRLNGHDICRKYVKKTTSKEARLEKNKAKFSRIDKRFLPEHYKTDQYFRCSDVVPNTKQVIVTQKLHGTSIRIGHTIVTRRLNLVEQIAKRLGVHIQETELDYVFGSNHVIKDINNPNQNHFYSTDIWTEEGRKLEGVLPENFLLYGELVGWTPEAAPIQKNYTYQVPTGTADLYVYRVAFVNGQGLVTDLSWDQVVEFCHDRALKTVPELWRGTMRTFKTKVQEFLDTDYRLKYPQAVPLDKDSPCDEGVCVRVDGMAPYILKAKSPMFYEHETKMADAEETDIEEENE